MNPADVMLSSYITLCHSYSVSPDQRYADSLTEQSKSSAPIQISIDNQRLIQITFIPIAKSLSYAPNIIQSINVSFNPLIKDSSAKYLFNSIISSKSITSINLGKTGITDLSGPMICRLIVELPLAYLNISSNSFTTVFYEKLATTMKAKQINLNNLDISNNGMGDANSLMLLSAALKYTKICCLSLSRNKLKSKFGYSILSIIGSIDVLYLKALDLSYNSISETVIKEIMSKLSQNVENSQILQEESVHISGKAVSQYYTTSRSSINNTRGSPQEALLDNHTGANISRDLKNHSSMEKRQMVKQYVGSGYSKSQRNMRSKSVFQISPFIKKGIDTSKEDIRDKINKSSQKLQQAEEYIS